MMPGTWIDDPPRLRSECPAVADRARLDRGTVVAPASRGRRPAHRRRLVQGAQHDQPGCARTPKEGHRVPAVSGAPLPAGRPEGLLKTLDFDRLAPGVNFPAKGAKSLPVDFSHVGGLPVKLPFGGQIFAMGKGRSVVPHGHDNMATGFLVLKGNFRGRHYDRIEDHADHYIIRPTIDREFQPGEFSTISDHKDNVHGSRPRVKPDSSSTST